MYLLACAVLALVALSQALPRTAGGLEALAAGEPRVAQRRAALGLLLMLPVLLVLSPVATSIYDALRFASGNPVSISSGRPSVVIGLVGGVLVFVMSVGTLFHRRRRADFWFVGRALASSAAATVVVVASISQLAFISAKESGMVGFGHFREQVRDVQCEADIVLANWAGAPDAPVVFRCPTAFLLNRYATTPFIPWPDYVETLSVDLAVALDQVLHEAKP